MSTLQSTVNTEKIKLTVDGMNKDNFIPVRSALMSLLAKNAKIDKDIVILCIGTDRCNGDSYAPFVGTFLSNMSNLSGKCKIIGTLENPVHAKNLTETLDKIDQDNTLVIAIDACLGEKNNIGNLLISTDTIKAGKAMDKKLPECGDISIAGVVNISGELAFMILQNTRLHTVYTMAETTARALAEAIEIIHQYKEIVRTNAKEKAVEKLMAYTK